MSSMLPVVDDVLQCVKSSELKSTEWGIRAFKAPFDRLRLPPPPDRKLRSRLLQACIYLYNVRLRDIELSQARSVYGNMSENQQPWVERNLNEE